MLNIPAVFHCFKFSVNSFYLGEKLRAVGVEFTSNLARGTWMSPPLKTGQMAHETTFMETSSFRPPAACQDPSLGTAVERASIKCHLQLATKAEDRSLISQSVVSLMSDQDHRYILEIAWRTCTTMYVNVGTEFGPNFLLEVGKGNTF